MTDRWSSVIVALREQFAADADIVEVEAYLSLHGYNRRQIGEILSLLYSDTAFSHDSGADMMLRHAPLRVQGPHERGRFTAEAWGYLVQLGGSGAVNFNDFEQLVERALVHIDGRISLSDIRGIAEDVGVDDGSVNGERPQVH